MDKSLGNCGHYDDCKSCKCYQCESTMQCGTCIDCTGSMSMNDDPFANFKESCEEFKSSKKSSILEFIMNEETIDGASRQNSYLSTLPEFSGRDDMIKIIKTRDLFFKDNDEFNKHQIARQDEIENAVFDMIKILTCNDKLPWDMEIIGDIADKVCDYLTEKGFLIYYPNISDDDNGNSSISDFYGI